MKLSVVFLIVVLASFLVSCTGSDLNQPPSTFDAPFPKKSKNLKDILGSELILKNGKDTTYLSILTSNNLGIIKNKKTNDTLFMGTVCKYRGLYFFNHQLSDSTYSIHAVKIKDNLIYGLNSAWEQSWYILENLKKEPSCPALKYFNSDSSKAKLKTDKRELKKLFRTIITQITPDTIINLNQTPLKETQNNTIFSKQEDYEYLSKAYPNPTSTILTVELLEKEFVNFQLCSLNGKVILTGNFTNKRNTLDLSKEPSGTYILTLINEEDQQKESIKVLKTD